MVNGRCVSPMGGQFVAFNIHKVNPFNQMISRDSRLAALFFKPSCTSSGAASKEGVLCLQNLQLHDKLSQHTTQALIPKLNRLMNLGNRPTTLITGNHSIFDALIEMENFNS